MTRAIAAGAALALTMVAAPALAHFQMIIPSDEMVGQGENRGVNLDLRFWHPLEGHGMHMAKPARFGVMIRGDKQTDLLGTLKEVTLKDRAGASRKGFATRYEVKKPGDHVFFVEPAPYWEPAEDSFIIHYTKVVVNGLGMEVGWDKPVGLKTEIVPLTRPYGLWTGNLFQGRVLLDGKPVPHSEVEVEYYDAKGEIHPPADSMITQVIKADANGVFTYAMPKAGWWGFAALNTAAKPMKHDGADKAVELGAVLWVKTHDMK
ncbi:MAG: DUF4198 domain-containing protein [Nitrospirae bacterium]|nr:DUF4198 domain-containing protein [Nitrospirota bacterium]